MAVSVFSYCCFKASKPTCCNIAGAPSSSVWIPGSNTLHGSTVLDNSNRLGNDMHPVVDVLISNKDLSVSQCLVAVPLTRRREAEVVVAAKMTHNTRWRVMVDG